MAARVRIPREKLAIYCCQQLGDMLLKSIAELFSMEYEGGVSFAIHTINKDLERKMVRQSLKSNEKNI